MGYLERVFRASEEENRRTILAALPAGSGGALLDLGAGTGEFTLRVAERLHASRRVGVELVPARAAEARSRGIDILETDLEQSLPVEGDAFKTVHANQVIEHVRNTDLFLAEIRRVLAPDGIACISTNNLASWHNVLSLAFGLQPPPLHVSDEVIVGNPLNPAHELAHADPRQAHIRLFTARSLRELCTHHGLRPVDLRSAGYYPLPPRAARLAAGLDPLHAAFLVGLFRPAS
jgi:SAM-dependent methyltransferase